MTLENKLNLSDQVALAKAEERLSKQKVKQLFDSGDIAKVEVGITIGDRPRLFINANTLPKPWPSCQNLASYFVLESSHD